MSRIRKDPRREREGHQVQGPSRRRYDLAAIAQPSRRPRRDLRAERSVAEIAGTMRRRLDRTQTVAGVSHPAIQPASNMRRAIAPAVRTVAEPAYLVFAVIEGAKGRLSRFDRQVLGAARLLADAGSAGGAVVALAGSTIADLGEAGADRILLIAPNIVEPAFARLDRLLEAVQATNPRHVIFAEDGDSADLARRLSVRLGEPLMSDCVQLTAKQASRRRNGNRAEEAGSPPRLLTIEEDRVAAYAGLPCEARPLEHESGAASFADPAILSVELVPGDPAELSLSETDFVVSAGNGVSDFGAFRDLAASLRATPGASRVVCDAGLMPRSAQVGASGTVLAADCYLALGIAGAPQHLQGIAACEHVIAVNTDLHAAMIDRAGLAIIQDAQLVMPALVELLARRTSP